MLYAQNPETNEVNQKLRGYFQNLDKPSNPKLFLYDMAAHFADSSWFVLNSPDTNTAMIWKLAYRELYNSAYDTTTWPIIETIESQIDDMGSDTIPIGIIHYAYYGLKQDAMSTDTYFNFDTINDILHDKYPRPSYPYNEGEIFIAAPLKQEVSFANPVYKIDPHFFYYDTFNAVRFGKNARIQIDFGDGTGWHSYDPTIISYYQPNYQTTLTVNPVIRIREFDPAANVFGGTSTSNIWVGIAVAIPPDEIMTINGLNVGIYNGCNTNPASGKTVIYLEGIDVMDFTRSGNRNVEEIYSEMLHNDRIIQMKNQNYRFVVVDWQNSRVDMRFNALYILNLIQTLKAQATDDEQFIVIGESMGGVIARYLLTYMETREYMQRDISPFFQEQNDPQSQIYLALHPGIYDLPANWVELDKMHNTRLFISLDAPHRGANIPLAIQKAYRHVTAPLGNYLPIGLTQITTAFNLFLDAKAAKQLLIEHVNTESGSGFYKNYSSTADRQSFMDQLNIMGSYPQFAKVMLMSNGALSGAAQHNFYTNQPRQPNDKLLYFDSEIFMRVLGIKIPLLGARLDVRTNPDGDGKILEASAGKYKIRIKLKWFGIRVTAGYNSLLNIQDYANTRPYCTSAGSYQGNRISTAIDTVPSSHNWTMSSKWLFNFFHYTNVNDGNGCYKFNAHVGLNGYFSANFRYNLCSDGPFFGFVPVQSALDYGPGNTLGLASNIEAENINIKLAQIPERVDIMVGIPNNPQPEFRNLDHLFFRNDGIFNLTNVPAPFPRDFTYWSCVGVTPDVERGFINLEIGDEELYLENNVLPYTAEYKVEYDLHLNDRNPHYQYPSSTSTAFPVLPGIYSKQANFTIAPGGFATFRYDATNGPAGHIGFYGIAPVNSTLIDEPLLNCCQNFLLRGNAPKALSNEGIISLLPKRFDKPKLAGSTIFSNKRNIISETDKLVIYPNPSNGKVVTLSFAQNHTTLQSLVTLYNMQGKRLMQKIIYPAYGLKAINFSIDLSNMQLANGAYYFKVDNGLNFSTTNYFLIAK